MTTTMTGAIEVRGGSLSSPDAKLAPSSSSSSPVAVIVSTVSATVAAVTTIAVWVRRGTQTPEEADRERTTMTTTMTGAIEVRGGSLSSPSCSSCSRSPVLLLLLSCRGHSLDCLCDRSRGDHHSVRL
jgi:hypothetical protein